MEVISFCYCTACLPTRPAIEYKLTKITYTNKIHTKRFLKTERRRKHKIFISFFSLYYIFQLECYPEGTSILDVSLSLQTLEISAVLHFTPFSQLSFQAFVVYPGYFGVYRPTSVKIHPVYPP